MAAKHRPSPADPSDRFLESAVAARLCGVPRDEALSIVADTYCAPWSDEAPAGAMVATNDNARAVA